MDTEITNKAVPSHIRSEFKCFFCRGLYKALNDDIKPSEKSKQQHFQKLIQCCRKYQWPNSLNDYFQLNFNQMEITIELCTDCLQSLEKLFEMNELLEEMQDGINDFINEFSKEVMDYQNHREFEKSTTLQMPELSEDLLVKDIYTKYSSDIENIEVRLDYTHWFCFPMEDTEESDNFAIEERSFSQKTHFENTQLQGSVTTESDYNFPEENTRTQEKILIANYNASNLGALYQLKNLVVVLQRLDLTGEDMENISKDCKTQNQIFKCNVCQIEFHNKILLTRHLATHNIKSDEDIVIFGLPNNLKDANTAETVEHLPRSQFHTKDFDIHHKSVSDCNKKENKCKELYKKDVHENFTITNCESNERFSSYDSDLMKCKICHILIQQENIFSHFKSHLKYTCHICGVTFNSTNKLNVHKSRVHSDKLPHKCLICDLTFKTTRNRKEHEKDKHSSEKTLECDICGKRYSCTKSSYFLQHQRSHFIKYNCNLCDKSFKSRVILVRHQQYVHGKDESKFQCEYCPKKFRHQNELMRHIRIHTGEKPFKCTKCEKGFHTKGGLYSHSMVHTDATFPCKFCGKLLKKYYLSTHINKVHRTKEQII